MKTKLWKILVLCLTITALVMSVQALPVSADHIHVWTVAAVGENGDKASVACTADDCPYTKDKTYTATITATGKEYDGTAVIASIDKETGFPSEIATDIKYKAKEGSSTTYAESAEAPSAVGEYTAFSTISDGKEQPTTVTISKDFAITAKSLTDAMMTIEPASFTYDGFYKYPDVVLKDGETPLTANTDYELHTEGSTAYASAVGTYTITVDGKGNYQGLASGTWKILTAPTVTAPTASAITYGQTLSTSELTGGSAVDGETRIPGSFAWKDPNTKPTASGETPASYPAVFTPEGDTYGPVEVQVPVQVNKADPTIGNDLSATPITVGQALSASQLTGTAKVGETTVEGTFTWAEGTETYPRLADSDTTAYNVTFTPTDTANYNTASTTATVTVNPIETTITEMPSAGGLTYGDALDDSELTGGKVMAGSTEVSGRFTWEDGNEIYPEVADSGSTAFTVVFTPDDANYAAATATMTVTVAKATPDITSEPTATAITEGDTLATSTLSGEATVPGSFEWADGTIEPKLADSNTTQYAVTFTPIDTDNYNTVSTTATLEVMEEDPDPDTKTTYTITYDLNGGKLDNQTGKVTVKVEEGTEITLPKPTKTGYTFDYWKGSKYKAGAKYKVTGDHTFTAQWKKTSTVTPKKVATVSTVNSGKTGSSKTGDTGSNTLWIILLIASIASVTLIVALRREHSRQ